MLEGILLIIFFIVGGLTAIAAIFFLLTALFRKSKAMLTFGIFASIVPIVLYLITYWYYDIFIPRQNKLEETEYVGKYISNTGKELTEDGLPDKNFFHLTINSNNTFDLEINNYINFSGQGQWNSGETDDGQLTFKDRNSIVFWATPISNNSIEVEMSNGNKIIFYKN